MHKLNIGDLILYKTLDNSKEFPGLVVGFNKKGEGGKEYVHVLCGNTGTIVVVFTFMIFPFCLK